MSKILELSSIDAGYNGKKVLRGVNLEVSENDFIGVIGPNGGGKTTLMKLIIGLLKPQKGKIHYYKNDKTCKRLSIGYLPQSNPTDKIFPITVHELVVSGLMREKGLFGNYRKKDKDLATETMEMMGISNLIKKNAGEISGGQLQRALLARAIISNPQLLILDEPSTYVDNVFEHDLYRILQKLNERMAIIMVSHDIGTISSYIKTIACVNGALHYHQSNEISEKMLATYGCPIDLITHGEVPHRVLPKHKH